MSIGVLFQILEREQQNMNIENLKVGQEVRGYKNLCELLEIPYKKNKADKDEQLNELKEFIDFTQVSQRKFIINEIKSVVGELSDGRKDGNNSVYKDDLRLLVLHMLKQDKSETMLISRSKLFEITSMVSPNYRLGQKDIEKLSELLKVPTDFIYDFYSTNNSKLKNITDRNMLSFSDSEHLFKVNIVTAVAMVKVHVMKNELNEPLLDSKGTVIDRKNLEYREATEKENLFINRCEYDVRKHLEETHNKKLSDTRDVFAHGLWNEYKKLIGKKLKANNIAFYYRAYKIMYNNDIIKELWTEFSTKSTKHHRKELNNKIIKSAQQTTKTNNTKAINSNKETVKTKIHSDNEYLNYNQKMVDNLININAPNIKKELIFEQQNIFDILTE